MTFKSGLLLFALTGAISTFAQKTPTPVVSETEAPGLVKWYTFKEAMELNKKQSKPFLVDIYTDWCGWCKKMMATTYSDKNMAGYINTWFYPVKFNAEGHDTIDYLGTKYVNAGTGPRSTHQLAIKFLGKNLSYPSTIFLSNNFQFQLNTSGYLESRALEPILVYTVENIFRTTGYEEFKSYFEKAFYDTSKVKDPEIRWYSLTEAQKLNKKEPRKFIVDIYTNWCNGCKVMNRTTFNDKHVRNYISKHYYLVDLNAESKDSLSFEGKVYKNNGTNGSPFHDLVMELTHRSLSLPTLVIMDEGLKTLDTLPYYLSPLTLEPILEFYGDGSYKTQKWPDYLKKFKEKQK